MKYFLALIAGFCFFAFAWAASPVNVNTATAEEISENLKGIGLSKAQSIVEYREKNGSFLHADELVKVKGIGLKTIDNNRDLIVLQDDNTAPKD
jgi:competence protein ComEA